MAQRSAHSADFPKAELLPVPKTPYRGVLETGSSSVGGLYVWRGRPYVLIHD
jgi:hypothetical protein